MEKSLMAKNKSNNKRPLGFLASPVVLIRTSSVLFVLLMFGHTAAYPWNSTRVPQETQLGDSMKSVEFVFLGEHSTYWNLYFGWGIWMAVSLLTLAIILWLLSDLSHVAPRNVGVISGVISATSVIGAYLSFRFFYIPPIIFYSVICVLLAAAAVQLLKHRPIN
jgi:hypothetical protein